MTTAIFLPPERMMRYQLSKAVGAVFFVAIFAGWLFIQWSNPAMRIVAGLLLLMTVWFTLRSIVADAVRGRGRQLSIEAGDLIIERPTGVQRVPLASVAGAEWREDAEETLGLHFHDPAGRELAHLDAAFLVSQSEARTFLRWAREKSGLELPTKWPEA